MKKDQTVLFALLVAMSSLHFGCEEGETPSARVELSPSEVFFEVPSAGELNRAVEVTITNGGDSNLIISSVTLEETDSNKEVVVRDAEEWSEAVTVESNESVRLTLLWTPTDFIIDRGSVTLETNVGEVGLSFTTSPLNDLPADGLCGDGELQEPEECDDGNNALETCAYGEPSCEVCAPNCKLEVGETSVCGDGEQSEEETCDDANQESGDGCSDQCTVEDGFSCLGGECTSECGDSIQASDEACDDGNLITERCEYSVESCEVCASDCTVQAGETSLCGDGVRTIEEGCDDGNTVTETCEYGRRECQICDSECNLQAGETTFCGDREISDEEQCDDGNYANNDGCSANCELEREEIQAVQTKPVNVFATNLAPGITEGALQDYLKSKLDLAVTCKKVVNPNGRYSSFRITGECMDPKVFYAAEIWPAGTYVRRFFNHHRRVQHGARNTEVL